MDLRNPQHLAEDLVDFDEFCQLVPDGQKADLIDGVIHMASPDSFRATRLEKFIGFLMEGFIMSHQLTGAVVGSRFAFQLTDTRAPEPDVAYIGPDRMEHVKPNYMVGGPDIAVEIVSRESRQRDYHEKRELYRQAEVREYWIIDPIQRRAEFLRLKGEQYGIVPLEDNRIFRSKVLPGFWLNVDWLIGDSLPNTAQCLREILAA